MPRPEAPAFSYTVTAAATSCSAVPELSKIVISSGARPTWPATDHDVCELGVNAVTRQETCRQSVMELTDVGALIEDVHHERGASEQGGLELLLLRVIRSNRGDEGPQRDIARLEKSSA